MGQTTTTKETAFLSWFFPPLRYLRAARVTYRKEFLLVAALFVVSGLIAYVVERELAVQDRMEGRLGIGYPRAASSVDMVFRALPLLVERDKAIEDPNDDALAKINKALEEGDTEKANRAAAEIDWNAYLAASSAPRVSEVLAELWLDLLGWILLETLCLVLLGSIFGVFPVVLTIANGAGMGLYLMQLLHWQNLGGIGCWWTLPAWMTLALASLLSAAIGCDMAKSITHRDLFTGLKAHGRKGLAVWWMTVVPAIVWAMVYLAGVFAVVQGVVGDPRVSC